MNTLRLLVATPAAQALGWTLFHSLWQGAIAAAILALVLTATRSALVRYTAAYLALLLIAASFTATFLYLLPKSGQGGAHQNASSLPPWNLAIIGEGRGPITNGFAALIPWLTPLWYAGVCLFYLRQLVGWRGLQRLRTRGVCAAPTPWQETLTRLAAELRISRSVALLESCFTQTPIVLGHFRPVILIPLGVATGFPAAHIEALLLHELAHIRRHDYLANVSQRVFEGLLFHHPAVWWISRTIRNERENCCDDAVVALRGNAYEYATALTALEHNRFTAGEPALAANGGNLMNRIYRLLYPQRTVSIVAPLIASALLLATATTILFAWQSPAPTATQTPWEKWLKEDVAYIITDVERAAFERLASDPERAKFIEQFWQLRDPTPDTETNEYKQEHYRRLTYADAAFSAGIPGSKTDRGRIYIVYGPADEIESHPSGEGNGPPFEEWLYKHLPGVGDRVIIRFVDQNRTGEYRMTRDPNVIP